MRDRAATVRKRFFLLFLSFLALAPACARKQSASVERLAILPFENLSSNSNLSWIGRAAAAAIVYDLTPSRNVSAQNVESIAASYSMDATRAVQGYFFESNGKVGFRVTVEDLRRTKTVDSFELDGLVSEGVLPLVNGLAAKLSPAARPFGTSKEEAFRDYGQALTAADRPTALRALEAATAADPGFSSAYLAWAKVLAGGGDRDKALKVLAAAKDAHPNAIEAAELEYLLSTVTSDVNAREKALETLTRDAPPNYARLRELAELQLSERKFSGAVRNFEAAAKLSSEDPGIWNQLGYAYAFAQDLAGARRALETYQRALGPADVNGLDSLGEVSFYLGDFAGAEKYFLEASAKNSAELLKAAQARLMTGDLPGADGFFQKYLSAIQATQRELAGYQQAQWEFLTGRRKAGMQRLEQILAKLPGEGPAVGACQLSIWKLQTGDSAGAVSMADQAVKSAQSPAVRNMSAMCRAVAEGSKANSNSPVANAFGLMLARRYAEALPIIEKIYRETNPSFDGQVRTLLAWAYVENGRAADAKQLVALYPIPLSAGDPLFASLIFSKFLSLRDVLLQSKQDHDLYLKLGGDVAHALCVPCRDSSRYLHASIENSLDAARKVRAPRQRADELAFDLRRGNFPRILRIPCIAMLHTIVKMQVRRSAQTFVVETRQAQRFSQIFLEIM
jgi:Flp pilus assembly protein TadD